MASDSHQKSGSSGRKRSTSNNPAPQRPAGAQVRPRGEREAPLKRIAPPRTRAAEHQPPLSHNKAQPDRNPNAKSGRRPLTEAQKHSNLKRQERDRRRRARTARRLSLIALVLLVLALICWGAYSTVHASFFSVKTVLVKGNVVLSDSMVQDALKLVPADTVILLNRKLLKKRIGVHPWVKSVEIKKQLPDTLIVTVAEREPLVFVRKSAEETWLLSKDWYWLGRIDRTTGTVFVGPAFSQAQTLKPVLESLVTVLDVPAMKSVAGVVCTNREIVNAAQIVGGITPELRTQVDTVSAPDIAKTKMITNTGIEIAVGSSKDIRIKDRIIRSILTEQKGKVVIINVRTIDKPTWRGLTK